MTRLTCKTLGRNPDIPPSVPLDGHTNIRLLPNNNHIWQTTNILACDEDYIRVKIRSDPLSYTVPATNACIPWPIVPVPLDVLEAVSAVGSSEQMAQCVGEDSVTVLVDSQQELMLVGRFGHLGEHDQQYSQGSLELHTFVDFYTKFILNICFARKVVLMELRVNNISERGVTGKWIQCHS